MENDHITQHFRREEQSIVQECTQWLQEVEDYYAPILTSFLDPRTQYILQNLANHYQISVYFDGGVENAERQRAYLYPSYEKASRDKMELQLIQIQYATKFNHLEHRQILGTLLGNGIKREYIGDIITDGDQWQCVVSAHLTEYLCIQIEKIANVSVKLQPISFDKQVKPKMDYSTKHQTVSSLRLDNIIANVYNISRQQAKQLVANERCKVNHAVVVHSERELAEHDLISVRGYGRFLLKEIGELTRKQRYPITVDIAQK